jgi:hypothetical protein
MMWKRFRALFKGTPAAHVAPPLDFDETRSAVEAILTLDLSTLHFRDIYDDQVSNVLKRMDRGIDDVRQRANGYPKNPISADVWLSGNGYGTLASALASHFKNVGWLKREENATALWAKAVLAVNSHYHHMVGPAMLANADCHDRLGNIELSSYIYSGVVKDFVFLLDEEADDAAVPTDDDRIALECLMRASERLLARGATKLDSIDLAQIRARIAHVLSRPMSDK